MKVICKDHQSNLEPTKPLGRSVNAVSLDVDRLLGPKSLEQLINLEKQISSKLQSDEPIDVEYWEHLLRSIAVYKAKAELGKVYKSIIEGRLNGLRLEQQREAESAREKLSLVLVGTDASKSSSTEGEAHSMSHVEYIPVLDPEPHLKLRSQDKAMDVITEQAFLDHIVRQQPSRCRNQANANLL